MRRGKEKLFNSLRKGEWNITILSLLEAEADINVRLDDMETLLSCVTEYGNFEIVKYLVERGADVNVKNRDGTTPLHIAVIHDHNHILEFFLQLEIVVDRRDKDNFTPLHYAAQKGRLKAALSLIQKGADLEAKTSKDETPLLLSVIHSCKEIAEMLIGAGANIHVSDKRKLTVLHYAVTQDGWIEIIKSLLNKGADINKRTPYFHLTPLRQAVEHGRKEVVELLLDAGADISFRDGNHRSVLHHVSPCIEIVQLLLDRGADINARDMAGDTPSLVAIKGGHQYRGVVELFVQSGADVNTQGFLDYSLLHYAVRTGNKDLVKLLLCKNADIHARNVDGKTPLLCIRNSNSDKDMYDFLINAGADVNCYDKHHQRALHRASGRGSRMEVVQYLLDEGATANVKTLEGDTPLHIACYWNENEEIIQLLLDAGCDCNAENMDGCTPLNLLIEAGPKAEYVRLLIESGACLKPVDYCRLLEKPESKESILQDVEICSQALINKFNREDLPALYKCPLKNLPFVEKMEICALKYPGIVQVVFETVQNEIQSKGHFNFLEVQPMVLSMFCVKSLIKYYNRV